MAQLLETKIKDPRLGFVTVTDARVSGDLQSASIFYTVLGGEDERAATAAALESAKGVLRSAVGKDLGTRITPSLNSFWMDFQNPRRRLIHFLSEFTHSMQRLLKHVKMPSQL